MLYISPSNPVLFAIDPNNGDMYVVDVSRKKASINKNYSEDDSEDEIPNPPSPDIPPPKLQLKKPTEDTE
jgi:hypothetical protein